MWLLLIAALSATGCNRSGDVNEEVKELERAKQESPEVAQDLRQQLEEKKAEVVQLEEKLALAERGVTDRVMEERNELKAAVKEQEKDLQREVKEAQGAARVHNTSAERARQELEATKSPGHVEAEVKTERTMIPSDTHVEVQKERREVPIETTETIERPTNTATPEAAPNSP